MTYKHILIVEDEQKVAAILKEYLEKSGYRTTIAGRGDQAVAQVRKISPDMMLLDLMLPGMDGMAVCREVRKFSDIPIIMITAKVEEIDRLLGLEIGADDYVCKPFSPRELVARIKAVLRRTNPEPVGKNLAIGPIAIDEASHQAKVSDQELDLTPNEFRLLQVLISQPGRVFSRDELLSRVQGYDCDGYDRTIDSHIKNLRKKIATQLPGQEIITTVYGMGYKLSYNPEKLCGPD
jgi:two-component system response regulator BaeR